MRESQGGNSRAGPWRQELKQGPRRCTASWLAPHGWPSQFLKHARTMGSGTAPPTVQWALSHINHQSGKFPTGSPTDQFHLDVCRGTTYILLVGVGRWHRCSVSQWEYSGYHIARRTLARHNRLRPRGPYHVSLRPPSFLSLSFSEVTQSQAFGYRNRKHMRQSGGNTSIHHADDGDSIISSRSSSLAEHLRQPSLKIAKVTAKWCK